MIIDKNNLNKLSELHDKIHDRYFSLSTILYDRERLECKVRFGDKKLGPYDYLLSIKHVNDYQYRDKEKIEIYSMNKFFVNVKKESIVLECNENLNINFSVNSTFEIRVDKI